MKNISKTILFPLTSSSNINVTITKKRMKNIRLSISKNGVVAVSMPYHTSYAYAYQFLTRKRDWIIAQLNKINLNLAHNSCNFTNNGNIFLLGHSYPLTVSQSAKNKVVFDNSFTIYSKDLNSEYIKLVFTKWCKAYFLNFFTNRLNFIYSQVFKDNNPPIIKIKQMKSMWGNCNFVKRVVTLNIFLSKTPVECIDYVILHELAHLVYHNHSKDFYNFVQNIMPDYKQRKKQLNSYSLNF